MMGNTTQLHNFLVVSVLCVCVCLKVVPDEHVIDEGDDGDNFYVIDK